MKCVCKKVSVCLKCLFASRQCVFASNCCSKDSFAKSCCFNICHENIGKGIKTAVFVPIAVPWFCR